MNPHPPQIRRVSRLNQRLALAHTIAIRITNAAAVILLALLAGVILSRA